MNDSPMDKLLEKIDWERIKGSLPEALPLDSLPAVLAALLLLLVLWLVIRARSAKGSRPRFTLFDWLGLKIARLWIALRYSTSEAADVLRYMSVSREARYRRPWVALIGDPHAGRTSLAHSLRDGRRVDLPAEEAELSGPGTEWTFHDNGVLIDIEGDVDQRAWHGALDQLDHFRPERALDALVVSVSARALLDGNERQLQEMAERCRQQVAAIQQRLQLSLPVYLVVTQCDAIPGFRAFWGIQPKKRAEEMVGWSSPYEIGIPFDAEWIDEAFNQLDLGLSAAQISAAATGHSIEEADDFFLFPNRFAALRAPTRLLLERLFRPGALREGGPFRGVYFTGVSTTPPIEDESKLDVREDVDFVNDLFEQRVFAESNLARPTTTGILSRNRYIRRFQLAMIALFGSLLLALAVSSVALNSQINAANTAHTILGEIKSHAHKEHGCTEKEIIYKLLGNVARIDLDLSYAVIPASWFDKRVSRLNAQSIADNTFEDVIFASLACHLEERALQLVEHETPSAAEEASSRGIEQTVNGMLGYAAEAAALERNIERFRRIAPSKSDGFTQELIDDFAELAYYLFGEKLSSEVLTANSPLIRALAEVGYTQPLSLPERMGAQVADRIIEQAKSARARLEHYIDGGPKLAAAVEKNPDTANIRAFNDWLTWIRDHWIEARPEEGLCARRGAALAESVDYLIDEAGYPDRLRAAARGFDEERCERPITRRLATMDIGPYATPLQRGSDGAGALLEEIDGFNQLLQMEFTRPTPAAAFQCRMPIRGWDGERLKEAARYVAGYQRFVRDHGPAAEGGQRRLYQRVARERLRETLNSVLTEAQIQTTISATLTSVRLSPLSEADEALETEAADFRRTMDDLLVILALYRQLDFDGDRAQVVQCARDFAAHALNRVDTLAEWSRLYEPERNLPGVDPSRPYFALGNAAQTKDYVERNLNRGRILASYAEPYVTFMKNTLWAKDANLSNRELGVYWEHTINEINRFTQFNETNGQVAHIADLFEKQLAPATPENCSTLLTEYQPPAEGSDLFSLHRARLEYQLEWYCRDHARAVLYERYRGLAKRFNSELAGRFPFAPLYASDASPEAVRRFFLDYAELREPLRAAVDALKGEEWSDVSAFIEDLDRAAAFFATNLTAEGGGQAVAMTVGFRDLPRQSPGSDQVVNWRLDAGDETISYPNGGDKLSWRFGDPLSLRLDWAARSSAEPILDAEQSDMRVDGRRVTFTNEGPWALLRMIIAHRGVDNAMIGRTRNEPLSLRFNVPVITAGQGGDRRTGARLHLKLSIDGSDPASGAPMAVPFPRDFPHAAPMLW